MSEANKDQHEPSMEEILASIRRIISEDSEGGETAPAAPEAKPSAAAPAPAPSPRPAAPAAPLGAATAAAQPAAPKRPLIADVEEEEDDGDVLLLTEEAADEVEESVATPIDELPPAPAPEELTVRQVQPPPLAAGTDEPVRDEPPAHDGVHLISEEDRLVSEHERLLSKRAAAATLAAMSELVTRSQREPNIESVPMGQTNQTLEDLTRDLLRPILKSWLDDNLPQIVERIVREEIGRLALDAQRR